ncbi:MAG: SEC-C domain-containing protein, partial [Armatimonadetes bacterium]|nr:SEC-C domain-containing protein [Armatimonadota bacterium]
DGDARKPAFDALAKRLEISGAEPLKRFEESLRYGIPHNVLNAKFHEQEARIIAEAGRDGAVTIATNMAGRGVDILLGGTHYKDIENADGTTPAETDTSYRRGGKYGRVAEAHVVGARDAADEPELLGPAGAGTIAIEEHDVAKEREAVKSVGGLYILGTERHESRRIDNQLRGRAGRQGDPGASHFNVSLEDYLWRVFGDRNKGFLMDQWRDDEAVQMPFLAKMIENAQKKVEAHNFDGRKHVLEYDDIMNVQREVIYRERRKILEGTDLKETILNYLHGAVDEATVIYLSDTVPSDEWDRAGLLESVGQLFPLMNYVSAEEIESLGKEEILEKFHDTVEQAYADKEAEIGEENMRDFERRIAQRVLDQAWVAHLSDMDYLREGIGLRGYAQVDPLVAYKKEALELFERMQGGIQGDIARQLFMSGADTGSGDVFQMFGGGEEGEGIDEETLRQIIAQMTAQAGLTDEDGNAIEGYDEGEETPMIPGFAPVNRRRPVPVNAGQMAQAMPPEVGSLLAAVANAAQEKSDVVDFSNALPDEPCPCGSGKPFKRCHRNR